MACGHKRRDASPTPEQMGNGDIDGCLYKYRHLVENAFARLKHFTVIATRYGKFKINFESLRALACSIIWLPM
jgi:hypothetical protein